jgi:4a-hydroxytetrahydrobiopterin dehydratase
MPREFAFMKPHADKATGSAFRALYWRAVCGDDDWEAALSKAKSAQVYSASEIATHIQAHLPHWRFDDGCLVRRYQTSGWKGTLMVINAIGHLAEAAWHHPDLSASYSWVEVRLMSHDAKGVTDKDFALAAKIEEVVQWNPGKEGGALEGTPTDDKSAAYIKYD